MNLRKVSDEVFVAEDSIVRFGGEEIDFLKRQMQASARKRARICAHKTNADALHEMVIAISSDSYIHPHKHIGKSESFHIVEGEVDVVVFDEEGEVRDVVKLGDSASGRQFYYRLSDSLFHTLLIRTNLLILHEVTNGPFDRSRTILAPFAPNEEHTADVRDYMKRVSAAVARHLGS
jgi:cupin fold WbuC family metalloprotein